jgi:predicted O-linked N-acetylglucosamine transferase (SPINDLY family)
MKKRGAADPPRNKLSSGSNGDTWFSQALTLHQAGKLDEARKLYERILAKNDRHVSALSNLGIILLQRGHREKGIELIRRSLAIDPGQPVTVNTLGIALQTENRLSEALASFDRALALRPDYAEAHYNRGNTLLRLNRLDEAVASYDRAIALRPNFFEAHGNRGLSLENLNRLAEALASYDRALALQPDAVHPHNNRGNILKELGRLDEALASYDRALALQPDYVEAHYNRGNALQFFLHRPDEALVSYERAIDLKPDFPYLLGTWMHCKMHCCDWTNLDAAWARVKNAIDRGETVAAPFVIPAIPASPAQQQRCARICIRDRFPPRAAPLARERHISHDRVRIGYFSSDFCDHPVSHLITQLIENHDRARFEVIGFSLGPNIRDAWRERLERAFDRLVDVESRTNREVAGLARELEIDIAVDLNGFTKGARTGIFALRAAPVQVNYLGFAGTLGADYMDYLIADATVIPPEHRQYYDEKIIYLPHCFQVNNTTREVSDRPLRRAELGLPDGGFVFCCFNHNYKITPDVFDIWMRLLRATDGSVLWLSGGNAAAARNLRREAEKRGVSRERLVFAPRVEKLADHLARYRQADLFLDTFYYNAHTTASDALWAGLPVLTCLGETFAGRVAASLLHAIGLPELITPTHDEYEALALELASQPARLESLRRRLAANKTTQPLFDIAVFTRHIERAYQMMHERHRAGKLPEHIVVNP